jgi:hypothetical protein
MGTEETFEMLNVKRPVVVLARSISAARPVDDNSQINTHRGNGPPERQRIRWF